MRFDLDANIQSVLEEACVRILRSPEALGGGSPIHTKKPGDVLIEADVYCDRIYAQTAETIDAHYHSEESFGDMSVCDREELILLSDPIDGSSEFGRYGPHRSPVTTAAMALRGQSVTAAVVGDLWNGTVYGLDTDGLYVYTHKPDSAAKRRIVLSDRRRATRLEDACVTVYAPNKLLMGLVYPHLHERVPYVGSGGGIGTQLAVAEMEADHALCASIEPKPSGLYEHIGAILASRAGAHASRVDGTELLLDPRCLQTSMIATSKTLAGDIWATLQGAYSQAEMPQHVWFGTPEAKAFCSY